MHGTRPTRAVAAAGVLLLAGGLAGGCVYRVEKETAVPAASPPTTVVVSGQPQRTVAHPEGRWEMYGDGKGTPYYWVWIPAGANPPALPPPPPRP